MHFRKTLMALLLGRAPNRVRTRDVAFQYRMGAGSPGEVNRTHPFWIEPNNFSVANPPSAYGQFTLVDLADANRGQRPFAAGDTAITMPWGVLARPYPVQASTGGAYGAQGLGAASPVTGTANDIMRKGYALVQLDAAAGVPKKGDAVFIWCAASSGNHVQGAVETVATGGSTAALDPSRVMFNGSPDANGVVEIIIL